MLLLAILLGFLAVFIFAIQLFPVQIFEKREDIIEEETESFFLKFKPVFQLFAPLNSRLRLTAYKEKISKNLLYAGEPGNLTVDEFMGFQEFMFIVVMFICYVVLSMRTGFMLVLFGGLSLYYPQIWLNGIVSKRKTDLVRNLPDFLDLVTLAVEAGLDFGQAVNKVISTGKPNTLKQEFRRLLQEIRLGSTREDALRALANRTDVAELNSFVTSLIQATEIGSSLGRTLRIQSDQMRLKRFQRVEKLAGEAPVKMLIPLMLFTFPALMIMIAGPLLFKIFAGF